VSSLSQICDRAVCVVRPMWVLTLNRVFYSFVEKHFQFGNEFLRGVLFPTWGVWLKGIRACTNNIGMKKESDCQNSFGEVAIQHIDALYGFAMTLTRDQTEAEDLVQETYLRAAQAFGRLMPDSNLKAWLFAIMRNIWLNQLRHKRNGPRFVELDAQEVPPDGPGFLRNDPYLSYVTKIDSKRMREAIESLPEPFREVIVLRDMEGFSYRQIASVLGCPAGTVMSRIARARERLRRVIADCQVALAAKAH
jgi:RNA polymerase sigma-70 factor, ECF subfamily